MRKEITTIKNQRKVHRLKITFFILIAVIVLIGARWILQQSINNQELSETKVNYQSTPTLLIPGYLANRLTFDGMIGSLAKFKLATRAAVIHISSSGNISIDQVANLKKDNPLIQVLFQNNRSESVQYHQLAKLLKLLKQNYHIDSVDLVGHSLGGNVIFDYLTDQHLQKSEYPTTKKFVNISSTFPGDENQGKFLPRKLQILNISGNLWNLKTDGVIPLKGNLQLGKIVTPFVQSYKSKVITGGLFSAYHITLHENGEVDKIISQFLFS